MGIARTLVRYSTGIRSEVWEPVAGEGLNFPGSEMYGSELSGPSVKLFLMSLTCINDVAREMGDRSLSLPKTLSTEKGQ